MSRSVVQLLVLLLFVASNLAFEALTAEIYSRHDFPPGFVFGAGSSAYQVEGAVNQDGRTPSIWDTYTDGRGPVNPKGLQYYNNLINELIRNGIEPHVTLHQFDRPQELEDEYGGWVNKRIVRDFTAYADVCFKNFGDRVSHWTTINEANVYVLGGYDLGMFPPNRCSAPFCIRGNSSTSRGNSSTEPYLAAHHMILSHAQIATLYRKNYQEKQHGSLGINLFGFWFIPLTNSTADVSATQRANDFHLGWFLHPMVYGDYPTSMKINVGSRLPRFTELETKMVKGSLDFIAVNFYMAVYVKDNPKSLDMDNRDFNADTGASLITGQLNSPWLSPALAPPSFEIPVAPRALKGLLEYIGESYPNHPIYIHENGQRTTRNSSLEDSSRVECLHGYIGGVLDAIRDGVDVRGYFTWALMDGFELFDGFMSAYGLYYVDLDDPDLGRIPKLSAAWYSEFLKGNNISSDGEIEEKSLRASTWLSSNVACTSRKNCVAAELQYE